MAHQATRFFWSTQAMCESSLCQARMAAQVLDSISLGLLWILPKMVGKNKFSFHNFILFALLQAVMDSTREATALSWVPTTRPCIPMPSTVNGTSRWLLVNIYNCSWMTFEHRLVVIGCAFLSATHRLPIIRFAACRAGVRWRWILITFVWASRLMCPVEEDLTWHGWPLNQMMVVFLCQSSILLK